MSAPSIRVAGGRSLGRLFFEASQRHADRLALNVDGRQWTYRELRERVLIIASIIHRESSAMPYPLCAVFASRTAQDYVGVLGALTAGAGYVALNAKFPSERNARILAASGCACLVASTHAGEALDDLLAAAPHPLVVILPDAGDSAALVARHATHRFIAAAELTDVGLLEGPAPVDENGIAYLMFTSGTTGVPKGVMVTHANVLHHLAVMWERYGIDDNDRFSQTFDLTFDLSVFDMFACWGKGASLHVVPVKQQLAPAQFINEHALTIWFSVPSIGAMLRGLRLLKANAFPLLRLSLFCGERLPAAIAEAWQSAAPNSILENLYGPTEVTIACTLHRWDRQRSPERCVDGVVPIGVAYDGLAVAIVDEALRVVATGERGELCVRGPQVSAGYWRDPVATADRFVEMPWDSGPQNRWYRTGDLALFDAAGELIHCGRSDDQVKLRGFRIELGEVEHALREASGADAVAVIAWPVTPLGATGLVGFVAAAASLDVPALRADLRRKLPEYMVPADVIRLEHLPLNANGKIDKRALRTFLEGNDGDSK